MNGAKIWRIRRTGTSYGNVGWGFGWRDWETNMFPYIGSPDERTFTYKPTHNPRIAFYLTSLASGGLTI